MTTIIGSGGSGGKAVAAVAVHPKQRLTVLILVNMQSSLTLSLKARSKV